MGAAEAGRGEGGGGRAPDVVPDAAIDRLFREHDRPDVPGAAVAVIRGGRSVLVRAYGAARLDGPVAVTEQTAFRLASITKQFTARAVQLLVEEGALSLHTAAGAVLEGLPSWGAEVRVGHLLAHTAGLPDYEALIPTGRTAPVSDREVVGLLAREPELRSPPGARFAYSNGGYALLAVIVEEVSGASFTTFLRDRLFVPLGMTGSVAHVEGVTEVPHRALGYRRVRSGWSDADQGVTTAVLGDGGVYASVRDLARWERALQEPGFQPDPGTLAPFAAPVATGVRYGFGWYLDRFRGRARQRHEGWSTGFQNEIQRFPAAGLAVVVLTNRASPPVRRLAEAIATRLLPGT